MQRPRGRRFTASPRCISPALREALARKPGLEVERRLESLLSHSRNLAQSPETLRNVRVLQVLEQLNSSRSRALLAEIAKGATDADETVEALFALERLSRRAANQR
jgi:hypothetical protein